MSMRAQIGRVLRRWADRIDCDGAPRAIGWSFTIEHKRGIVFHDGGNQGCPLWYLGKNDYQRAHREADTDHVIIDWRTMSTRFGKTP